MFMSRGPGLLAMCLICPIIKVLCLATSFVDRRHEIILAVTILGNQKGTHYVLIGTCELIKMNKVISINVFLSL